MGLDGFDQFNKKYGEMLPDGTYQVPARWQAGLSNVSSAEESRWKFWIELMKIGCLCRRNYWPLYQWICL